MTHLILIVLGFLLLAAGGEFAVRGAVASAKRFGLSPFFIGAVIIGFGSSLPELVTSLEAMLAGSPGIAVGNIVGSNIANILLVLGLAALINPFCLRGKDVRRDSIIAVAATTAFVLVSMRLGLSFPVGLGLLAALVLYLGLSYMWGNGEQDVDDDVGAATSALSSLGMIVAGLVILIGGGYCVVTGGIGLAEAFGVQDTLIGLTIVAVGTTLPEIVTSVVAALRKHGDVALGNVLGSCMFNILAIGGTLAVLTPTEVPASIAQFDNWIMLAVTVLLALLVFAVGRLSRTMGFAMLVAYAGYLAVIWP